MKKESLGSYTLSIAAESGLAIKDTNKLTAISSKGGTASLIVSADKGLTASKKLTYKITKDDGTEGEDSVTLSPFYVNTASINNGQFEVIVPDLNGKKGTLQLLFRNTGSTTSETVFATKTEQGAGQVSISLDEVMDKNTSPLDAHDKEKYNRVCAKWTLGTGAGAIPCRTSDKNFTDVTGVEVLAKRYLSNFFTPDWDGVWDWTATKKGAYNYPLPDNRTNLVIADLYNVEKNSSFWVSFGALNEGLAMQGDTVIRSYPRSAFAGFAQSTATGAGNAAVGGYVEYPSRDQKTTGTGSPVNHLRDTSVAVKIGTADRLKYNDRLYIPSFSIRTVDDHGGFGGDSDRDIDSAKHIDVWRGKGGSSLKSTCDNFSKNYRTCLKILP